MFKCSTIFCSSFLIWIFLVQVNYAEKLLSLNARYSQIIDGVEYLISEWREWEPWSKCSKSCGGGIHKRFKYCISRNVIVVPDHHCLWKIIKGKPVKQKKGSETLSCNVKPCVESYKCYSENRNAYYLYNLLATRHYAGRFCCNKNMGLAAFKDIKKNIRDRMAKFDRYWTANKQCAYITGGKKVHGNCDGPAYILCEKKSSSCPREPFIWADWREWSGCTKTCGGGIRTRSRRCVREAANVPDKRCPGPPAENGACSEKECPIMFDCFYHEGTSFYFYELLGNYTYARKFCEEKKMQLPVHSNTSEEIRKKMLHDTYWAEKPIGAKSSQCFYIDRHQLYWDVQCIFPRYIACMTKSKNCHKGKVLCYHCSGEKNCSSMDKSVLMDYSIVSKKVSQPCEICMSKVKKNSQVVERGCLNKKKDDCNKMVPYYSVSGRPMRKKVRINCCTRNKCNQNEKSKR